MFTFFEKQKSSEIRKQWRINKLIILLQKLTAKAANMGMLQGYRDDCKDLLDNYSSIANVSDPVINHLEAIIPFLQKCIETKQQPCRKDQCLIITKVQPSSTGRMIEIHADICPREGKNRHTSPGTQPVRLIVDPLTYHIMSEAEFMRDEKSTVNYGSYAQWLPKPEERLEQHSSSYTFISEPTTAKSRRSSPQEKSVSDKKRPSLSDSDVKLWIWHKLKAIAADQNANTSCQADAKAASEFLVPTRAYVR